MFYWLLLLQPDTKLVAASENPAYVLKKQKTAVASLFFVSPRLVSPLFIIN